MEMSITYQREEPREEKAKRVNELKALISKYENILLLDIEGVPTPMLQNLREDLWDKGQLRVVKNRLAKIAISQLDDKEIEVLENYLSGMRAFFFADKDLFESARIVSKTKKKLPPKAGKKASKKVVLQEGGTGLKTGPEMRDLRVANVPIRIIDGEIFVKESTTVIEEGETITPREAKAMNILGIKPLEAKVDVVVGYKDNKIIPREALIRSIEDYEQMFKEGVIQASNLAMEGNLPTKSNITHHLRNAVRITQTFALQSSLISSKTSNTLISNAYRIGKMVQEKIPESSEET